VKFTPLAIAEVLLIEPRIIEDDRGFLFESYRLDEFEGARIRAAFVQENHSNSNQGVLRGLHYQIRRPQGKLVRVIAGEVFDVAVDLRRGSGTFGRHVGQRLAAEDHLQVWIPPGFAHGFYTLSDSAEVLYKVTEAYFPEWDRTLIWNDPDVGIDWPLVGGRPPVLSAKDARGARLQECETYDG